MNRSLRLALGLGFVLSLPAAVTVGCFFGEEQACTLDGDCPKGDTCAAGRCQPKPCKSDAECGVSNECVKHMCVGGICKPDLPAGDLALEMQTPNDCVKLSCDGRGNLQTLPDPSDLPLDDGNPCTEEVCGANGGEHPFTMAGGDCMLNDVDKGVCDGAGTCVQCVVSESCTSGDNARCLEHQCVSCSNGVQDTDEQGLDCGGVCPKQCILGPCTMDRECTNGLQCSGNVCRWTNGHECTTDSECGSLLCAPSGSGKTCQACTANSQCASHSCTQSGVCNPP